MPDLEDDDNEWEVQEIRDAKTFDGVLHYLVKWQVRIRLMGSGSQGFYQYVLRAVR